MRWGGLECAPRWTFESNKYQPNRKLKLLPLSQITRIHRDIDKSSINLKGLRNFQSKLQDWIFNVEFCSDVH